MSNYNFDRLANRDNDYSKKWSKCFIEGRFGPVPDDYISMWIADMDYELAPPIYNHLENLLSKKTLAYIYPYEEFFKAIQYWMSFKTKNKVPLEEITLDYSIVNSLYHVVQTFTKPGDRVLINTPVYNPFREATKRNHAVLVENEMVINEENRYVIDFEALERQMVEQHPKIYILCNPHNPGGTVWSREDLNKIAELCLKYNIILISDEAHSDHINQGTFTSALELDEKYRQNLVYLNSPNKAFNIAGLKTSYVIIPSHKLRTQYRETLEECHVEEPNVFGAAALIAGYTPEGREWVESSFDYIIKNYEWAKAFMAKETPMLKVMPMDASYVMWVNVSQTGMDGDTFTRKLAQEEGILFQEGSSFGQGGEDFVRINLGTSQELVQKAFNRMAKWLNEKNIQEQEGE